MHIADFALERYFARVGVRRRDTCSARRTPSRWSMGELLALADDDARAAVGFAATRLHRVARTAGAARRDRAAVSGTRPPTTSSRSPAPRRACSCACTRCSARAITPSSCGRRISRCTKSRARSARRSRSCRSTRATGRSTSTPSPRRCGRTRKSIVINFPHSPTGAQLDRRAVRATDRASPSCTARICSPTRCIGSSSTARRGSPTGRRDARRAASASA